MSAAVITFTSYTNVIMPGNAGPQPPTPDTSPLLYVWHTELAAGRSSGPEEDFGDNAHAKRVLRCRWQDRMTLAWQLLGGPTILGNPGNPTAAQANAKYSLSASTGDILVFSPHQYPYNAQLVCQSVSMRGEGNPSNKNAIWDSRINLTNVPAPDTINNFDHAILECSYVTPQEYTASGNGYQLFFKENLSPATEFITLPRNNLYWDNAQTIPINVNEAPAFEIKRWMWTVTRRKVCPTGTLLPLIRAAQGQVSSDNLVSNFFNAGWNAGYVLFEGATLEPDSMNDGTPALKVDLKFKCSTVMWNKFPHVFNSSGGVNFDTIYNADGSAFKMFPTGALGPLISSAYW